MINKIICSSKRLYYSIYERLRLKYARKKYNAYKDIYPLITVYTPTYNRAKILIERAIPSVLNQTYPNFEYIIVGDGCTDNTEELVKTINDPRIKFYNIKRKRPHHNYDSKRDWFISGSNAANYALKKTKGKWLARIDDDDIWTIDHLEQLLYYTFRNNLEFVTSKYKIKDIGKEKLVGGTFASEYLKMNTKRINPRIGGHSTFFYRSYLKFMKYNLQAWRKKWNRVDDSDMLERMVKIGVRMGFLKEVTLIIKPRPGETEIGFKAIKGINK